MAADQSPSELFVEQLLAFGKGDVYKRQVIAGTEYHSWPVYDSDGTRLFSYAPRTGPGMRDVVTADLTGDGRPEIIFAGQDSFVHVVSPTGQLLWKFGTGDEVSSVDVYKRQGPQRQAAGTGGSSGSALRGRRTNFNDQT